MTAPSPHEPRSLHLREPVVVPTSEWRPPYYTNVAAVLSLVLGALWFGGVGSVLALVLGYHARREINRNPGLQSGRRFATVGIWLGWLGVVATLIVLYHYRGGRDSMDPGP